MKPAAASIPYSHAKGKKKTRPAYFFLDAAEKILHSHGKEKNTHFFLGAAVKDLASRGRKIP